jgi:transcription elongation factor SPT4
MRNQAERVDECTSANFDGMIAVIKPEESWVARWQRIGE